MVRKWIQIVVAIVQAVLGCAPQTPYRPGNAATEVVVADPHLCYELTEPSTYRIPIAYLEIDEQGQFQDRGQIEKALAIISGSANTKYIVVFVHGWFHSASQADENVQRFKCALNNLQRIGSNRQEQVIGVYIGWRGESWSLPGVRYATFWDRKNTSDEVGRGSLVEFLTRLERVVKPTAESANKLMLVGHSLGASVVFNSIGSILMERFLLDAERLASKSSGPAHPETKPGLVSGYGDLVVLINPAIEATRIVPFFGVLNEYTRTEATLLSPAQMPRLVVLSSEGDWATRKTFPAARVFSTMLESYADRQMVTPYGVTINLGERYLDRQTMGNVEEIQTHFPLHGSSDWSANCPPAEPKWLTSAIDARKAGQQKKSEEETGAGWQKTFGAASIEVRHRGITTPSNPLWIMAVGTELIPDHSSIVNPSLICFLDELLGDPTSTMLEGQHHQRERLKK